MRSFKATSGCAIMLAAFVVALGIPGSAVPQTPPDPATGTWKFTRVVNADACNACVQAKGCDRELAACTDKCNSTYPPNDRRGAQCLDRCTGLQNRCVRDAQKMCQACRP
jgi:hypothetical protein